MSGSNSIDTAWLLQQVKFPADGNGLVPAIVQNPESKDVLMLGFMNREALEKTLATGNVTFYTRSRKRLWTKGETSGNVLRFAGIRINCNEDSLLIFANPVGPTCHTMHPTCYYRQALADAWEVISEPEADPNEVYGKPHGH